MSASRWQAQSSSLEVGQADIDRECFCELLATALEVRAECRPHAVALANIAGCRVVLRGYHDPVIKERLVNSNGLLQEVVIVQANRYCLDTHGRCPISGECEVKSVLVLGSY